MKAHHQNDPRLPIEHCTLCDEPTGRAGRSEDSLYAAACTPAEVGPLCETCHETLTQTAELDRLRAEVDRLRGEREEERIEDFEAGAYWMTEMQWCRLYPKDQVREAARRRLAEERHE